MTRLSERGAGGVPGAGGAIGTGPFRRGRGSWHSVQRLALAALAGTTLSAVPGWGAGLGAAMALGLGHNAYAQDGMPAFVDDAPVARDTLRGLGELVARGGRAEAARALQRLLDESGSRAVATETDPDLFVSVRGAVHDRLLREPQLLETYGEVFEPRARELLAQGDAMQVESALLLTPSGFEAALRVAQSQLERAAFAASWRTLAQIDRHPSRTATRGAARDAAAAGALVLGYLPEDAGGRAMVARWHADADLAMPAIDPVTPPASALVRASGPLTGGPAVDLMGIVPRPLTSVALPAAEDAGGDGRGPSARRGVPIAQPWALPAVVGDRVYVNDGVAISAWDRFTLRPLWRAPQELGGAGALRGTGVGQRARLVEDATAVALAGRLIVGATGLALHSEREGDRRVHAVDRETGRVIWSVDPATLDPRLRDATVRGPVVVDGDIAVVSLRKNVRARRLISSWLVGLDLADGSARWVTLVSSAGSLPYQQRTRRSDAVLIDRGVIYRGDEVGIVGAVESATGRPVWIRRLTGADDSRRPGQVVAAVASPVRVGDDIALLSPGGDRLLRFDLATGEPRETVDFSAFGIFNTLLQVNGRLVALSGERALVFDENTLGAQAIPLAQVRFDGSRREVVGTASVVGDEVMIPVAAGVLFYDPARGTERLIELDVSGNAVAAEGQLVVVSLDAVHSFLVWDAASKVLMDRIDADPTDPAPPTTFAELAYRSGRFGSILGATDKAIAAASGLRDAERRRSAESELFGVLLSMVETSERDWGDDGKMDEARPTGGALEAPTRAGEPVITDSRLLGDLLDRLARLASTPEQRVSELMARGRFAEARSRPGEALEAYQTVLVDPQLSATSWRGASLSVRAELEATRRLKRLLVERDARLYEPFDAEADVRLAGLAADAGSVGAADYERLARAYPAARASVRAWRLAAEGHARAGRSHEAVRAARRGLESAGLLGELGRGVDGGEVGLLAGRLVETLVRAQRFDEALRAVGMLAEDYPGARLAGVDPQALGLGPDAAGEDGAVDPGAVRAELESRILASRRLAVVGRSVRSAEAPSVLGGYLLRAVMSVEPAGVDLARSWSDGALMVSPMSGTLTFLKPGGAGADGVRAAWSTRWEVDPILLRRDGATAWLYTPGDGGPEIHRVSLDDGSVIWSTPAWGELVGGLVSRDPMLAIGGSPGRIEPAVGRPVPHEQVVVVADHQTIVLVERTGRAVALDAGSGEPLWRSALGVTRVFDADVGAGLLVVAGLGPAPVREGAVDAGGGDLSDAMAIIDVRTGEAVGASQVRRGPVRWVRVSEEGTLFTGHDTGVVARDPSAGRINWELMEEPFAETNDAWVIGERVYLRTREGAIGVVDAKSGRVVRYELEGRGRLEALEGLRVFETGGTGSEAGGGLTFATGAGIASFDADAKAVAVDAFGAGTRLAPAAGAESVFVTVESRGLRPGVAGPAHVVHVIERGTGRLVSSTPVMLLGEVKGVEVVDGAVLVGAGDAVVVYPME